MDPLTSDRFGDNPAAVGPASPTGPTRVGRCGLVRHSHHAWDPASDQFYRGIEQWMFSNYTGPMPRSDPNGQRDGHTPIQAAWSDPTMLGSTIPNAINAGQNPGDNWNSALATLDSYDPHKVFSNTFLNTFMP